MKKLIPFIVVCSINLLALTNIHGQTLKKSTPQLKDYDVKNYFPTLGPSQIKDNSAAEKNALTETFTAKPLAFQSPKASLVKRNNYSDIYQLPIDQMLCIVPNNSVCYKMNFSKKGSCDLAENMPNSMKKQNWIPGESKKGNAR
jgi:hypothetical protein